MPSLTATCQCGKTAIELSGAPILGAICCCTSCRFAGTELAQAPGSPPVVRADGSTDYCLYRKDRVRIVAGGEHLQEHRLKPDSPTRRVVASCCNTPMFLDFAKGHWLTVYRDRIPAPAPPLTVRVMAKDAPAGTQFTDSIPTHPTHPPGSLIKLLASWAAMGFRRPQIAW